ncbi:MAG: YhbY family RNA-binding protein [Clostridia bacterium]|nr:YhbY family RNA-binding protein [Clostridia bacterium]
MTLEINSKQRAYLRSLCNNLQPVLYIGKEGITDATVKEAWDVLEARELIKCSVQREAPLTAREACQALCERVHAAPVQCIGGKFSVYRPRRKDPTIVLP